MSIPLPALFLRSMLVAAEEMDDGKSVVVRVFSYHKTPDQLRYGGYTIDALLHETVTVTLSRENRMPSIVVEDMPDGRHRLLVDNRQQGLYDTRAKAKAAARSYLRNGEGITWTDEPLGSVAEIGSKRRKRK